MKRLRPFAIQALAFFAGMAAIVKSPAGPALSTLTGISPEIIGSVAAPIIAESLPREYEGKKDWGKTTRVTSGLRSRGNFFKFDIHREKSKVKDGVWKKYKLTFVEPEKNLTVRIENVRSLDSNRYAFTLFVAAKVHGWARAKAYESGVHIISLEAEGDTSVRLWLDAEVGIETVKTSSFIPGVELKPVITDAKLKFDDFKLKRISDVRGSLARELGDLLRDAVEKELTGKKLTAKLNRSLQKHPERLRFTPDKLLGKMTPKDEKNSAAK